MKGRLRQVEHPSAVWDRLRSDGDADIIVPSDLLHRVQFPALAGDYALWYTEDRYSVMEVTTAGQKMLMTKSRRGSLTRMRSAFSAT